MPKVKRFHCQNLNEVGQPKTHHVNASDYDALVERLKGLAKAYNNRKSHLWYDLKRILDETGEEERK
jgi:hypothetical protein